MRLQHQNALGFFFLGGIKIIQLIQGDCLEQLSGLSADSVDSLITDPPAGISFMGKAWDDDKGGRKEWVAWLSEVMREAKRVMKPGAHGLVWAIPRTSHWTATALEDAGFEIRDVISHIFGSGFPKSHDISKGIDKQAGAEREIGSPKLRPDGTFRTNTDKSKGSSFQTGSNDKLDSLPSTPFGKQYAGWGTALKPAAEFWILIRKPCSESTVAKNVLKHGTGGLNIDASRITVDDNDPNKRNSKQTFYEHPDHLFKHSGKKRGAFAPQGRFPANLVFSCTEHCTEETHDIECAIRRLDEQSGVLNTHAGIGNYGDRPNKTAYGDGWKRPVNQKSDSGGASRFFYCAKASKSDKGTVNTHPTVKSTKLMSYLIKLITPIGGTVLDPFMGSGSTGVAAKREGFNFIGIEKEKEYFEIAGIRINKLDLLNQAL